MLKTNFRLSREDQRVHKGRVVFGTMDEVFEAITWMQLGIHAKPIAFLDVLEYWQPLARWIERSVDDGFVDADSAAKVCVDADLTRLLDAVAPA